MNEYLKKPVVICNLLLLVGRPLALIGVVMLMHAATSMAADREMLVVNGILLIASGFTAGWLGRIGKAVFYK